MLRLSMGSARASSLGLLHSRSQGGTFAGGKRGLQRQSDLGCFELVVGEARAHSLVESPSQRFSVVALKRCRQHRSRLGLLLAQRLPGLGEVPAR